MDRELGDVGFFGDFLYLDHEGGDFVLGGEAFGVFEDLAFDVGSVAPDVLELGYRSFELGFLGFFAGPLIVPGEILLPQGAEEQEVVGDREQDQDQGPQDEDVPIVAVH